MLIRTDCEAKVRHIQVMDTLKQLKGNKASPELNGECAGTAEKCETCDTNEYVTYEEEQD